MPARCPSWRLPSSGGVSGSVLVTWHAAGSGVTLTGDILVITSAVTAAGYAVLARHVTAHRDPIVVTAVQMLGALALAAPIFLYSTARGQSQPGTVGSGHLAVAIAVGLFGSVVPFLLFNRAITLVTATRAGLIAVLVPVLGAGASIPLVGEQITGLAIGGGLLAVVAALIAGVRPDNTRPPTNGDPNRTVHPLSPATAAQIPEPTHLSKAS